MSQDGRYDIVPAHLGFLSIYSPDLAEDSQLVFHYSRPLNQRRRRGKKTADTQDLHEQRESERRQDEHRRMRQIGLAQGMVNFARYVVSIPKTANFIPLTMLLGASLAQKT